MAHDALGEVRDELGISETLSADLFRRHSLRRYICGRHALPLLMVLVSPERYLVALVSGSALAFLVLLGGVSAGATSVFKASARVHFWGILAMALTAGVGALFGVAA